MDLHHLRYFVAVAERLNFGEAAEFVHVSQPGLSQQIKALEEEVGVLLLDRTKRSVTLTEAGKYFLAEAKLSLEHAERAIAVARKVSRGKLGKVRIGHVQSIPFSGLLTRLTSVFHRYVPDIHLEFVEGDPVDLLARILEGELDLGFIRLPHEGVPSEIAVRTILQEKVVVALREDHWLAKKKKIRCADLAGERFIRYYRKDGKSPLDEHQKAIAEKGGFRLQVSQEVQSVPTIIGLVAAGSGVAVVAESFRHINVPSVVFLPLVDLGLVSEIGVAYRRDERSPAVSWFLADLGTGQENVNATTRARLSALRRPETKGGAD
jgi:DNA-binding transcriptional LysR family regulator